MKSRPLVCKAIDRAQARKSWPVKKFGLGDEPADNLVRTTTAAERLAMLAELSEQAWALSGRPLPDYGRSATPIRRVRVGGGRVEERLTS